jgi:hypothetical protein
MCLRCKFNQRTAALLIQSAGCPPPSLWEVCSYAHAPPPPPPPPTHPPTSHSSCKGRSPSRHPLVADASALTHNLSFPMVIKRATPRAIVRVGASACVIMCALQRARWSSARGGARWWRRTQSLPWKDSDRLLVGGVRPNRTGGENQNAFDGCVRSFRGNSLVSIFGL